ncbi:terminase small subunit [Neobacillus sp.]|uniref:terminase small subunit n=1 Tax=Neobacillus sp. TaxID=2675273 RepID=UPI00289DB791|nr:terminase small subunit [Neobacillus sp.]
MTRKRKRTNKLTDKQKLFCTYYIKYYSATKAYQKAYNCSYDTANSEGYKHLVNPCIKREIERLKAKQHKQMYLDGMAVIQKYIDIAFADITDFLEYDNGHIKLKDTTQIDGTLIQELKINKDGSVSLKLNDKMKALEQLGKYFNLFSDQQHQRQMDEEQLNLNKKKYELDKRIVELREREEEKNKW